MLIGVALAGCATAPPVRSQTEIVLASAREVPPVHWIAEAPFVEQEQHFCGPAALAMAMRQAGRPADVDALTQMTVTPEARGAFQEDLVGAARRQGMLAIPVRGLRALLKEVAVDHPVIVLQNLAFTWWPKWHYAVVVGYDLERQELLMHSGNEAYRSVALRRFEDEWEKAEFWGLVVLPPGQLSASADDLDHAAAAAALERLGQNDAAARAYRALLDRWPRSLGGLLGQGNVRYARGDYMQAVHSLERATFWHPESVAARHNLAEARAAAARFSASR